MIRQGKNGPKGPHLKICGLTRAEDARYCVERRVAYVGFNLFPGSKRHLAAAAARALWMGLKEHGQTRPVAVVVDLQPHDLARQLADFPELAAVQFHGVETPAQLRGLRQVLGGRALWKALGIASATDVHRAEQFNDACDLLLLDNAKIPAGASVMGGSGQAFDWQLIDEYRAAPTLGVAGGVNPANARRLLDWPQVGLVDVSSGVESSPGVKDRAAIDALMRALKV